MRFRPCIDLLDGRVAQIVGGSLRRDENSGPDRNFETERPAADYARMYQEDGLLGGHVIMLGPGNESEALSALRAFPGGLQVGGEITPVNAGRFLDAGASHVVVTSYVFRNGEVDEARLGKMVAEVGRDRLVLDLSCRKRGEIYVVVTEGWQRFTKLEVGRAALEWLANFCSEFLVHGVDVEGKRLGIETALVKNLSAWSPLSVTYAGGANGIEDLDRVDALGNGRVDLTIGSALDIFGGDVSYRDVVAWQRGRDKS